MENLAIQGSTGEYFVPTVNFDANTGKCTISGESYLEDSVAFYEPLLGWLEAYMNTKKGPIEFEFKLTYFNTSSSKRIIDIFRLLKQYENQNGKVVVNWYYEDDDTDILEEIEDFTLISKLKINVITF
ncbi:MAG: hypothetical protein RIS47_2066 [Bacteroidota bacterium]|jgi:hypothetical protein